MIRMKVYTEQQFVRPPNLPGVFKDHTTDQSFHLLSDEFLQIETHLWTQLLIQQSTSIGHVFSSTTE